MELIFRRLSQMINVIISYCYKWSIDLGFRRIHSLRKTERNPQIILSLTSYGRRTKTSVVYYTLVSLLNQTLQPDRIVLCLDREKWNIDNIPDKLKSLLQYGVDIEFCKDVKSYTKLIPCLKKYPNDILITVDDDIIYPSNLIETLYSCHQEFPTCIVCGQGSLIEKKSDGKIMNYNDWKGALSRQFYKLLLPLGVKGVLYPPHSLYKDVINEELFMKLAPNADDLWFWMMGYLAGTKQMVIKVSKPYLSFDALYQFLHKGSALTHSNSKQNMNDVQLKAILKQYSIEL